MKIRVLALGILAGFLIAAAAAADQPLQPPHRYTVCSASKLFCVTSDPQDGTFAHRPDQPGLPSALWHIPKWFRVLYLSDNPELLVTGYDGANLIPLVHPEATEILTFWRHGAAFRTFKVPDILVDVRHLERTASHYHWGEYKGFDVAGYFHLSTVEGQELIFDPEKGSLLRRERSVG